MILRAFEIGVHPRRFGEQAPLRAFGEKPLGALPPKRGRPFTEYIRVGGDPIGNWDLPPPKEIQ